VIAQLRGKVVSTELDKDALRVVVDVNGIGYEALLCKSSDGRVAEGQTVTVLVSESVAAFDGATTLYGFLSREEKDFFQNLRENVDGMGPKKALETLDKISKSMPDFKRAVIDGDLGLLTSVFGFTKKTAEKLIFALKGKVEGWFVSGAPRFQDSPKNAQESEALSGLVNLGYREDEARELLARARGALGPNAATEKLLQEALRLSGARMS
jgi:holliday junction DNA helicase RuvA